MENTLTQGAVIAYCLYGGVIMGLCYDFLGLLRVDGALIWDAVLDTVFYLCVFFIACTILARANGLQPRPFALVSLALGYAIYRLSLGRLVSLALDRLRRLLVGLVAAFCALFE